MTEDEARDWIASNYGGAAAAQMEKLADIVTAEAGRQNLIAPSTLPQLWQRHIVDSAQLVALARDTPGTWIDIGTGAGFPGLVVAALTDRTMLLVEPRKRRAEFLVVAARELGLAGRVDVVAARMGGIATQAKVISARAVGSLDSLFSSGEAASGPDTLWILPKGRGARDEVAQARRTWHGVFHVEHSITDPQSLIVVARKVSRR